MMKALTKLQLENIKKTIHKNANEIKGIAPIYNKLWPQLELPDDIVYRLSLNSKDFYVLHHINPQEHFQPKIPTKKYSFVILHEDPTSIYCFSHAELYERSDLMSLAQGHINYGHSSLAFKREDKFIPPLDARKMAKPVLLAGHLIFSEHEHFSLGGGEMISWSVDSGHYRPSLKEAHENRIGYVKKLLPMDKFVNLFPS